MSNMLKYLGLVAALLICFYAGVKTSHFYQADKAGDFATPNSSIADSEIRSVLAEQDAAWNRGDIPAFMKDYWQSEDLRFASGGKVNRGYEATLNGYLTRYPDKAAMGQLSFTDLETQMMSATDALVFGRWELLRDTDKPGGLFTLHMRKIDGAWKIMSDHTSSN